MIPCLPRTLWLDRLARRLLQRRESLETTGMLQSIVVQLQLISAAYERVLTAKDRSPLHRHSIVQFS